MSFEIRWSARALKELRRLDRPTRKRILEAVETFAETESGNLRGLKGKLQGVHRLRVGMWRVLLQERGGAEIGILRIRPRGDAYKG